MNEKKIRVKVIKDFDIPNTGSFIVGEEVFFDKVLADSLVDRFLVVIIEEKNSQKNNKK